MYLHGEPKLIFERLYKSLLDEKQNIEIFKTKLVAAQKYDLAKEYSEIIDDIQMLMSKIKK